VGRGERSLAERESGGGGISEKSACTRVCERGGRQAGRERIEELVEGEYVLPKLSTKT
jgi:hypothetical protein